MKQITQEEFNNLTPVVAESVSTFSPEVFLNQSIGNTAPEDVFSGMFQIFFPRFVGLTRKLGNNQLRKLMRALIETPLNDKEYKFDDVTKEAFLLGEKLLTAKSMLIMHSMSLQNNKKEEETNGGPEVQTTGSGIDLQGEAGREQRLLPVSDEGGGNSDFQERGHSASGNQEE